MRIEKGFRPNLPPDTFKVFDRKTLAQYGILGGRPKGSTKKQMCITLDIGFAGFLKENYKNVSDQINNIIEEWIQLSPTIRIHEEAGETKKNYKRVYKQAPVEDNCPKCNSEHLDWRDPAYESNPERFEQIARCLTCHYQWIDTFSYHSSEFPT